jgi:hypothetical protein
VTFTWHKSEAERIAESWATYYKTVKVGGPAYEDPGTDFVPGMYLKTGCTITSRGCPKKCGWCAVPTREGAVRELPIKPGCTIALYGHKVQPMPCKNLWIMLPGYRAGR